MNPPATAMSLAFELALARLQERQAKRAAILRAATTTKGQANV
jgi:hypothetical protein